MAEPLFGRVAILGVGLIGGSLGLALRQRGLAGRVVGYSRTPATRARAIELGALDEAAASPEHAVDHADLVYLATPVAQIAPTLARIAAHLRPGALVTDAASVKGSVVAATEPLDLGGAAFCGGHPMAGSEAAGVEHARADLFEGMAYAICPSPGTPPWAVERLRALAEGIGSTAYELTPEAHDRAVAAISHLPHLLAAALVELAASRAAAGQPVFELAAGSWAGATRVAASDSRLWREILSGNREAVVAALDELTALLAEVRAELAGGEDTALETRLARARQIKVDHPGRRG